MLLRKPKKPSQDQILLGHGFSKLSHYTYMNATDGRVVKRALTGPKKTITVWRLYDSLSSGDYLQFLNFSRLMNHLEGINENED